ncbi:MAG: hypothetical protein ACFNUJ_05770 [Campylobacter curvus]
MSAEEIKDLRDFIDKNTVRLGEFSQGINGSFIGGKGSSLLDSADISIEEFKKEYLKANDELRKFLGLDKKDGSASINETAQKEEKFEPMQVVRKSQTYKYEASNELREIFGFIKSRYENGESLSEILENLAKAKRDIKA